MRTRQEDLVSALCHLFNAIPLWGLLFCGWIWFWQREESRRVSGQAQQAIVFHGLMMAGLLIWMLLEWLSRIINVLSPPLSRILSSINWGIITLWLLVYVAICFFGFARCLTGQSFGYPLVNRRP